MLRKARYRCLLYLLIMASARYTFYSLDKTKTTPNGRVSVAPLVYVNSLESSEYLVRHKDDGQSRDGLLVAQVLIKVDDMPASFTDVFGIRSSSGSTIELGRRVEVQPSVIEYQQRDDLKVDFAELESLDFILCALRSAPEDVVLTPAMERVLVEGSSKGGLVLNYPRTVAAVTANVLWAAGVFAFVAEAILAFLRGQRHEHKRHHDLCFQCSYQLTRDMRRCPECGQTISWRAYASPAPNARSRSSQQTPR